MNRNVLYPVVYQDHDESWRWSIASGTDYEPGHKIHDRREGYLTREDARKAMEKRLAELRGTAEPATHAQGTEPARTAAASAAARPAQVLPDWAVVVQGQIVAIFLDETDA